MRKKISIILMMLFGVCSSGWAEIITIGIEGVVDSIDDSGNLLEGNINTGDSVTGWYKYDTATPDSNIQSHVGEYTYSTGPFGISININDLIFQTDTTNVDYKVAIVNGVPGGGGGDQYFVGSNNNLLVNSDIYVESLFWQLTDYSYNAISSTELNYIPLDLSPWQSGNALVINGGLGGTPPKFDETFQIDGHVTSVYLIPEPGAILLFALGGLFLRKRS